MRHAPGRHIALNRRQHFAGQVRAQFVVRIPAEPRAKILLRLAIGQILPQQPLDGIGNQRRRAAIADRTRNCRMLAHRSAQAEVEGVGKLALVLDFFAFDADVRNPVLAATIRATGHVQLELLIKSRQPLLEFVNQPAW